MSVRLRHISDALEEDDFGCSVKDITGGVEVTLDQPLEEIGHYFHEHGNFPKSFRKALDNLESGVDCVLFKVKGERYSSVHVAYRYGACENFEGIVNGYDNALNDFLKAHTAYALEDVYSSNMQDLTEDEVCDAYPVWHLLEFFDREAYLYDAQSLKDVARLMCGLDMDDEVDWDYEENEHLPA